MRIGYWAMILLIYADLSHFSLLSGRIMKLHSRKHGFINCLMSNTKHIVADINGDGKKEVLVATNDAKIQHEDYEIAFKKTWVHNLSDVKYEAYRLPPPIVADINGDGKKEVVVATNDAKIQVLEPYAEARVLAEITLSLDVVAMATGVIDSYEHVLVVVTSGSSVLCFDHNLKKLWETNLPQNSQHREIAITISNYTVKHGDTGLVIVGGRMEMQPYGSQDSGGLNLGHFPVYAFDGKTGLLRWIKKTNVIEAQTSDASQFKCRDFRKSILGVMPHHWDQREDTLLKLAHFKLNKQACASKNLFHPNVVVAHHKEGIEAIHIHSGQTLFKLDLLEGGLHADVNGDGVLDHVQVHKTMQVLKPCRAVATSGTKQLFNVSICPYRFNFLRNGEFSRLLAQPRDISTLEVATPILIPGDGRRSQGYLIFLTNDGELTSYSTNGVWQWELETEAKWSNLPGLTETARMVPTLKPFLLRTHDKQPVILAGGDQAALLISLRGSIFSLRGSILASFELPSQPTHALLASDFSNDGLTDIILSTSNATYGFVQTRQPGALFLFALVGYFLEVAVFIVQYSHNIIRPRMYKAKSL